ncbi:MAG: P1 family peptidase [Deltaproteobacteria bacterium]|nr:P1 family peptidase [Deltaproteobacteria bacterium]
MKNSITQIPGITVGHWTDVEALTGCTVVLLPEGSRAGACVSGSASATRETPVISPGSWIEEIHALCLSGGSAFGLDAAGGVMRWLERRSVGHATRFGPVPIVPAACIYDLNQGDPSVRPGPEQAEAACEAASRDFETGRVGAGVGATCGKWRGLHAAVPAGVGTACKTVGGIMVGALAVASPVGDIVDADGTLLLGAGPGERALRGADVPNTVLVVAATNARMDRSWIARAVNPAHTLHDGDVGFFVSAGDAEAQHDVVFQLTSEAVSMSEQVPELG